MTEQIDALTTMGADPIHYLVVPRFLACILLIPTLTIMADFMGIVGGYFYSVIILGIDHAAYLNHSREGVAGFDLFSGIFKSIFFGAIIAVVSCYRGFHCEPGAEGVGKAATTAFVYSFVLILAVDLFLTIVMNSVYYTDLPQRNFVPMNAALASTNRTAAEIDAARPLDRGKERFGGFGKPRVLSDISLSIDRGQTVAIIGESGCGKTVFMKTLVGLIKPTEGRSRLMDVLLSEMSAKRVDTDSTAVWIRVSKRGVVRQHVDV